MNANYRGLISFFVAWPAGSICAFIGLAAHNGWHLSGIYFILILIYSFIPLAIFWALAFIAWCKFLSTDNSLWKPYHAGMIGIFGGYICMMVTMFIVFKQQNIQYEVSMILSAIADFSYVSLFGVPYGLIAGLTASILKAKGI